MPENFEEKKTARKVKNFNDIAKMFASKEHHNVKLEILEKFKKK